jgi:hypothetical protein
LVALKTLTVLLLEKTQVTAAGVKELKKALPKCYVCKLDACGGSF